MAASMFTRLPKARYLGNLNNGNGIQGVLSVTRHMGTNREAELDDFSKDLLEKKIKDTVDVYKSKAVELYMEEVKKHDELVKREVAEFNLGKRHLANIMGMNFYTFTKKDLARSIRYLFPSGLFEPRARPVMFHPEQTYAERKAAEFDNTGKPLHSLFYTLKPNYYQALYNISEQMNILNGKEDDLMNAGVLPSEAMKLTGVNAKWISKPALESTLLEKITDAEYEYLIAAADRLYNHPVSYLAAQFLGTYRKEIKNTVNLSIPRLMKDKNGRPYIVVEDCMRKSTRGSVTLRGEGSGKITVNGEDISYFHDVQAREQVVFPLIFANVGNTVDVEATVTGGGPTGQSGAIRWGIAWGLRSFVDQAMVEKMKIAGLLTRDWRKRERKKFGQEGARRKFTWKKR